MANLEEDPDGTPELQKEENPSTQTGKEQPETWAGNQKREVSERPSEVSDSRRRGWTTVSNAAKRSSEIRLENIHWIW